MEEWQRLEIHYSKLLRESNASVRRTLYRRAYSAVSELVKKSFESNKPEDRTSGTSKQLVRMLKKMVNKTDKVLEIGSGRGYTCLALSPFVKSITGIEVSKPSVEESLKLFSQRRITNVNIEDISALELDTHFRFNEFDLCLSIDVIEHLHPEDAREHIYQTLQILKPGGRYIIVMPNRLNGPHDLTKRVFPEAKYALGFHLNESTYREIIKIMSLAGYDEFKVFYNCNFFSMRKKLIILPFQFALLTEKIYQKFPMRMKMLEKYLPIHLIAYKPNSKYIS